MCRIKNKEREGCFEFQKGCILQSLAFCFKTTMKWKGESLVGNWNKALKEHECYTEHYPVKYIWYKQNFGSCLCSHLQVVFIILQYNYIQHCPEFETNFMFTYV
jgi:hypothetical protein